MEEIKKGKDQKIYHMKIKKFFMSETSQTITRRQAKIQEKKLQQIWQKINVLSKNNENAL